MIEPFVNEIERCRLCCEREKEENYKNEIFLNN